MTATLYIVGTPIGNLEDITMRAVRILSEADLIAAEDTRTAGKLLGHLKIKHKPFLSFFAGNEAAKGDIVLKALSEGRSVALISEAGMPVVSDPGAKLVSDAADAGYRVEVIPGPSAVTTAVVGSGLGGGEFRFIGFPPREQGPRHSLFGRLASDPSVTVMFESPERVGRTFSELAHAFGGGRRAALCRELTKLYEEFVRGTLDELAERYRDTPPRGECTVVVEGGVARPAVEDVESEVRQLLAEGLGPKDVAARLMIKTGKPRRQLYQLALSLKRSS